MNRRQWLSNTVLAATVLAATRGRSFAAGGRATAGGYIKLDQNENPYGISAKTEQAILEAVKRSNRYPGRELAALRDLIAEREQVSSDCVILGAGSTEVFSLACLLHGGDGKEVVAAEPTYSGFVSYVGQIRGRLVRVPVNDRWEIDLDGMARRATANTKMVYVCNPNNPTGTIADSAKLRQFCEDRAKQSVVLVDEAYYELVEVGRRASMVELVRKGSNVIVARTFSKVFGLAGLRIGYGIARPETIAELRRLQTTFCPANQLGVAAARAAYADAEFIALSRNRNAEARTGLYAVLEKLGHKVIPGSQANFVAFEAKGGSQQFAARLQQEHNIGVRTYQFLGKTWVRISIGTKEEMESLERALQTLA